MQYNGVVHLHSQYSYDAKLPLSELKALLQQGGVSFACMTEHTNELTAAEAAAFVAECRALSDERFVFVPGFEVPYKDPKVYHVLMIGATQFISAHAADAASLRDWSSAAPLVVLPHPVRNRFAYDETLIEIAHGVEIWNQQYDGRRVPRIRSYRLLRELRKQKPDLLATGGLDLHRSEHFTYPRYQVELGTLSEASILKALRTGAYQFGHSGCQLAGTGEWPEVAVLSVRLKSHLSTTMIGLSKKVNKTLGALGLSLPKSLKQAIRSRI